MPDSLDLIWKALANADRRRIVDMLREGPLATGEIVLAFPELSRFAVMQHLGVLEEAGLIVTQKEGRMVYNHLNVVPIQRIYERWVRPFEGLWAGALVSMKRTLEREQRRGRRGPSRAREPLLDRPRAPRSARTQEPRHG